MTLAHTLTAPGHRLNQRPEANPDTYGALARTLKRWQRSLTGVRTLKAFSTNAHAIDARREALSRLSEDNIRDLARSLRSDTLDGSSRDEQLIQVFALIDAVVARVRGFHLHDEQLFAGWLLMLGKLPEMATGEGKSLTAALAAITAAVWGTPVHVITSNDYLVARDAQNLTPIAEWFDLRVSFVNGDMSDDDRRAAYRAPICYVSNKQVAFDYLRDRSEDSAPMHSLAGQLSWLTESRSSQPLLQGLCFAIVDEADSALIDDAATPLILSAAGNEVGSSERLKAATGLFLAQQLSRDEHFTIDGAARQVLLTAEGEYRLAALAGSLKGTWKNRRYRSESVRSALSALYCFERDVDYLIDDGAVVLIDQSTGRSMPDRKLQHGLHQLIETKERCELTGENNVLANISFQQFFPRYLHLCGMTGTAREARRELAAVYGLPVVAVPPHRPNRRQHQPPTFARDNEEHIAAIMAAIVQARVAGQAILVGTRTLSLSERLYSELRAAGFDPALLNARQDLDEAETVAAAGQSGRITIATNIAGRGTDIPISSQVAKAGGLHVLICELNDNSRVDRQLFGRAARQGDRGSYQYVLSMEDSLLNRFAPAPLRNFLTARIPAPDPSWHKDCCSGDCRNVDERSTSYTRDKTAAPTFATAAPQIVGTLGLALCRLAQRRQERRQIRLRRQVAESGRTSTRDLSFAGYRE